jgi:hypothetical protein
MVGGACYLKQFSCGGYQQVIGISVGEGGHHKYVDL